MPVKKEYPSRYRNDKPPIPPNMPIIKTVDHAMSMIAKRRIFVAPRLTWEDNGNVTIYGVRTSNMAPHGITRSYIMRDYDSNAPLYVWDKATDQWYGNKTYPEGDIENHPLTPCVPPDKSIIYLPRTELDVLMIKGVMGLMEAKLRGDFDKKIGTYTWESPKDGNGPYFYIVYDEVTGAVWVKGEEK